jgi:hypothetical protein
MHRRNVLGVKLLSIRRQWQLKSPRRRLNTSRRMCGYVQTKMYATRISTLFMSYESQGYCRSTTVIRAESLSWYSQGCLGGSEAFHECDS